MLIRSLDDFPNPNDSYFMAYTVELQGGNIAPVCQVFWPHLYWSRMMELGISASSLCATEMWDSGESQLAEVVLPASRRPLIKQTRSHFR